MDRFSIVLGHYVFCNLHHEGQWSDRYQRLCRITRYLKLGPRFSENRFLDPDNDKDAMAREVYLALCERHGEEPARYEEREE
jgi:hypothetical protein